MATHELLADHHLSTSNEPPKEHEATILRAKVKDLHRLLKQLLRGPLADSESHVQAVKDQLEILKKVLAPVRRVPLEVLGEVFLRMSESDSRPRNYQGTVTRVSLVCKRWQDAARLSPHLWRDIWVKADAPRVSYEDVCAWVARAGKLPTQIEISSTQCAPMQAKPPKDISERRWDDDEDLILCAGDRCLFSNPVLFKILMQAPRAWHSITINCPSPGCLRNLVEGLDKFKLERQADNAAWSFNTAHIVEIGARNWSHWANIDEPEQRFGFIPSSTKNLTLHLPTQTEFGWYDGCWTTALGIPTSNLRNLTALELSFGVFTDISGSPLFNTLQHCANLEKLMMDFSASCISHPSRDPLEVEDRFTKQEVVLPNLHFLQLTQFPSACFDALQPLKMPALLELRITLEQDQIVHKLGKRGPCPLSMQGEYDEAPDAKPFIDFVRGDSDQESQLRVLHIKAASLYNGVLFHLLRDLRSLTHLRLEWLEFRSYTPEDSFSSLMTHTPWCLPNLKAMEILNLKHAPDYEVPSLLSFVEERKIELTVTHHDHEAALKEKKEDDRKYAALDGYDSDEKYWNPSGAIWWD